MGLETISENWNLVGSGSYLSWGNNIGFVFRFRPPPVLEGLLKIPDKRFTRNPEKEEGKLFTYY